MERDDPNVRLTVSDTGRGIDPNFLPFLFEGFRQSESARNRRYGGLGLGLSITKYLVEADGGKIWAVSEVGRGTKISFTFQS